MHCQKKLSPLATVSSTTPHEKKDMKSPLPVSSDKLSSSKVLLKKFRHALLNARHNESINQSRFIHARSHAHTLNLRIEQLERSERQNLWKIEQQLERLNELYFQLQCKTQEAETFKLRLETKERFDKEVDSQILELEELNTGLQKEVHQMFLKELKQHESKRRLKKEKAELQEENKKLKEQLEKLKKQQQETIKKQPQ